MSQHFRATALWNEVIHDFQTCMPLKRHRYKLISHDNTFTGKEASLFLFSRLRRNAIFGPDVKRQQVDLLLDKFLKTGVFEDLTECVSKSFRPTKKLYRFPKRLPLRQVPLPADQIRNTGREKMNHTSPVKYYGVLDHKCCEGIINARFSYSETDLNSLKNDETAVGSFNDGLPTYDMQEADDLYRLIWATKEKWKSKVTYRIKELVGVYVDVDSLISISDVPPIWPSINASCVQSLSVRKTNLPPWVNESLNTLGYSDFMRGQHETYEGYYKDIALVLCDYIEHLKRPLCSVLKSLLIESYKFLSELDVSHKSVSMESERKQQLLLNMKTPKKFTAQQRLGNRDLHEGQAYLWSMTTPKGKKGKSCEVVGNTSLPRGLCYETAFTSDEPVTRIVPKSDTDTITLKSSLNGRSKEESNGNKLLFDRWIYRRSTNNDNIHLPLRFPIKGDYDAVSTDSSDLNDFENPRLSEMLGSGSFSYSNIRNSNSLKEENYSRERGPCRQPVQRYSDDEIDYRQAIDSVEKLINFSVSAMVSASRPQGSDSDSLCSYSTRSCSMDHQSASEECDRYLSSSSMPEPVTCKQELHKSSSRVWERQVKYIGAHLFRLELLLLPPSKKVRLDIALFLIEMVSKMGKYRNVLPLKLMHKILPPEENEDYLISQNIIEFLVDHRQEVTKPFDIDQICGETGVSFNQELEHVTCNRFHAESFCSKISPKTFEEQKLTGSQTALAELLEQISNDQKMSEKERRKRLKQFQNAYPHIYARHFASADMLSGKIMTMSLSSPSLCGNARRCMKQMRF